MGNTGQEFVFVFKATNLFRRHEAFYQDLPRRMAESLTPEDYRVFARVWGQIDPDTVTGTSALPVAEFYVRLDEGDLALTFPEGTVDCHLRREPVFHLSDLFYISDRSRDYRETFISYLQSKRAFSSWRWFTDDAPGQEPVFEATPELPDGVALQASPLWQERMAWVEEQDRRAALDTGRRLDLSDLPELGDTWRRNVTESFAVATPGLLVLLLSTGASVMATTARFLRYDPT